MDWKPLFGLPLWVWLFVLPSGLAVICYFLRRSASAFLKPIWSILNVVYDTSGAIAAFFMVSILVIIVAQMICRWLGIVFPGSTEFAGYAMAATSFFALAHALNKGAHIRVSILLNMNQFTRKWLDVFALFIAALTATYFARYAVKTTQMSEMLNDRTQGLDKVPEQLLTFFELFITVPSKWGELWAASGTDMVFTPVWLPQLVMSAGSILLAIALWDNLIRLLVTGESAIKGETIE